jgi:RsiW-degrading membrane proteinase PrsW (M82 family)
MLLEALLGGLVIAAFVSYCLLRFFDRLPTKNPTLRSVILSFIVLMIVTLTIGGSSSYCALSDGLRYFLIGMSFNAVRILALGRAIGYGYDKVSGGAG